jgi:hypothetical protein
LNLNQEERDSVRSVTFDQQAPQTCSTEYHNNNVLYALTTIAIPCLSSNTTGPEMASLPLLQPTTLNSHPILPNHIRVEGEAGSCT